MQQFMFLVFILLLLIPLNGCLEENDVKTHIPVQLWAERYRPVVNTSNIQSRGLPEINISYIYAGEGIRNASVGEQVFLSYQIYMNNVEPFEATAHCRVNGQDLSPYDTIHAFIPTQYEESIRLGIPAPITDHQDVYTDNTYSFRWPYRFSYYGVHHIICYLETSDGTIHAKIERNITVLPQNTDDNRWALIITVDPLGEEIATWKDGAMAWSVLTQYYEFPVSHVLHLPNGIATRDNILLNMDWLAEQTNVDTTLVCWISAHGGIERFGDQDSEIRDGFLQLWDNRLYDGDLATFFAQTKSQHILSVIDTCFAGEFGGPDDFETIFTQLRGQYSIEDVGRVLMTAATTFTRSKTTENGGIFTILMAGALRGISDRRGKTPDNFPYGNDDGRISAEEAGYWAAFHCYSHIGYGFPQVNDLHSGDLFLKS